MSCQTFSATNHNIQTLHTIAPGICKPWTAKRPVLPVIVFMFYQ